MGLFMVYLDATIVNVALPDMQEDLSTSVSELQWIIDTYTLTFACLLLTSGTVGDRLGRKKLFLCGLITFTLTSMLCALSTSVEMLLIARALQGTAGAVMIPVSLSLISVTYKDPAARAKAIGIWSGMGGLALSVGPVLGGLLVDWSGWRSIFWVNIPIGVVATVALFLILTESRAPDAGRLDPVGQSLFIAGIAALAFGLIQGSAAGWTSALIIGAFACSVLLLAGFVAWERFTTAPLLPPSLFRNPVVMVAGTVNFLGLFGLFAAIFLLTLYLQNVNGLSTVQTGLRFLALTIPIMIASFVASVLAARVGPRWPIVVGSVFCAGGLLSLTRLEVGTGFGAYWWGLALLGVGVALTGAPATVAMLGVVSTEQSGMAAGILNTFRQVGAVFGVALSGALLLQRLRSGVPDALSAVPMPSTLRAEVADAVEKGELSKVSQLPPSLRQAVLNAVGSVYAEGMHLAMTVAAAGALLGGVLTLVLLRKPVVAVAAVRETEGGSATETADIAPNS
ncbi:MFS transporter [Actinomadura roseirufa]|uniref:MFS transporter n=1 Tax=Actinomadura roseirufa TaxID=2094049 RepID=UPI0013F17BB2|nr:MFS transporter [Actinomadura roseirufa]